MSNDGEGEASFDCSKEIEKYQCKTCPSFQTNLLASLKCHTRGDDGNISSEEEIWKCLRCSFETFSKYVIVQHSLSSECATRCEYLIEKRFVCLTKLNAKLNFKSSTKSCQSATADKWLHCEQCLYKSNHQGHLNRHIQCRHSRPEDIQLFICDRCGFKTKYKASLQRHIIYCHSKPENIRCFICDQCQFKFCHKTNLTRHIWVIHKRPEDIQWFICDRCGFKTKYNLSLKRHIISRHSKPQDIKWFKCEECTSQFKHKTSLKSHVTSCHSKPEDVSKRGSGKADKVMSQ